MAQKPAAAAAAASAASASSADDPPPPPPLLDLPTLLGPMSSLISSGRTHSPEWRLSQLSTLRLMVTENTRSILTALESDLGKDPVQATYTEIQTVTREIDYVSSNLRSWMRPTRVPTPAVMMPAYSEIRRVPLSTGGTGTTSTEDRPACLIVGSFNYPFSLCLLPAVGSLAGGNPTVIKPSERCPATADLLGKLVERYFEEGAVRAVLGGAKETELLLSRPWGLIFFTGSERVGRIVAESAGRTLTPAILELGGKTPCYVSHDAPSDLRTVADRIVWAKTLNCGQTCVAPDFVVCDEAHRSRLVGEMIKSLERMFGPDPRESELSRMVDARAAGRLVDMLREAEVAAEGAAAPDGKGGLRATKIECGGTKLCDAEDRYVAPTIVVDPPPTSRLMTEEIFGPVLPVLTASTEREAVNIIRSIPGGTPLNLCVFTSSASTYDRIVRSCPSAGSHRNDCVVANGSPHLPFGGLGNSGYGRYHGRYSFEAFTHEHLSLYKPCHWLWEFKGLRYHPYGGSDMFVKLNELPSVPVMRRARALLTLALALWLVLAYVPAARPVAGAALNGVADLLSLTAERVRPGDGDDEAWS